MKIRIFRFEKGASGAYVYERTIDVEPVMMTLHVKLGDGASSALQRRRVRCVLVPDENADDGAFTCTIDEDEGRACVFLPARPKAARKKGGR